MLAASVHHQQWFSFHLCTSFSAVLFLSLPSFTVLLSHPLPPPLPISPTFASGCTFNGVWWSPHVSAGSLGLSAGCCLILQHTASDLSWRSQVSPVRLNGSSTSPTVFRGMVKFPLVRPYSSCICVFGGCDLFESQRHTFLYMSCLSLLIKTNVNHWGSLSCQCKTHTGGILLSLFYLCHLHIRSACCYLSPFSPL